MPHSVGERDALRVAEQLAQLPDSHEYAIDFSHAQHFEPFGMLVVGSAIRTLRRRQLKDLSTPEVHIKGVDMSRQGHAYAERALFWESLDESFRSDITSLRSRFIPITRLHRADVSAAAGHRDPVRSGLIEELSAKLASDLGFDHELEAALMFSFTELLRNVLEHSHGDSIWLTAAARPTERDIQVAIMDEGRGIRKALSEEPQYAFPDDLSAIRASLKPGVSGRKNRRKTAQYMERLLEEYSPEEIAKYDNYGFGLTMCSELFRRAGSFLVASGEAAMWLGLYHDSHVTTCHRGTALRFTLHEDRVDGVLSDIKKELSHQASPSALISRSMQIRLGL